MKVLNCLMLILSINSILSQFANVQLNMDIGEGNRVFIQQIEKEYFYVQDIIKEETHGYILDPKTITSSSVGVIYSFLLNKFYSKNIYVTKIKEDFDELYYLSYNEAYLILRNITASEDKIFKNFSISDRTFFATLINNGITELDIYSADIDDSGLNLRIYDISGNVMTKTRNGSFQRCKGLLLENKDCIVIHCITESIGNLNIYTFSIEENAFISTVEIPDFSPASTPFTKVNSIEIENRIIIFCGSYNYESQKNLNCYSSQILNTLQIKQKQQNNFTDIGGDDECLIFSSRTYAAYLETGCGCGKRFAIDGDLNEIEDKPQDAGNYYNVVNNDFLVRLKVFSGNIVNYISYNYPTCEDFTVNQSDLSMATNFMTSLSGYKILFLNIIPQISLYVSNSLIEYSRELLNINTLKIQVIEPISYNLDYYLTSSDDAIDHFSKRCSIKITLPDVTCYDTCAACYATGTKSDHKCTICQFNYVFSYDKKVCVNEKSPDNYYLEKDGTFLMCYKTCESCNRGGNSSEHYCNSCKDGYSHSTDKVSGFNCGIIADFNLFSINNIIEVEGEEGILSFSLESSSYYPNETEFFNLRIENPTSGIEPFASCSITNGLTKCLLKVTNKKLVEGKNIVVSEQVVETNTHLLQIPLKESEGTIHFERIDSNNLDFSEIIQEPGKLILKSQYKFVNISSLFYESGNSISNNLQEGNLIEIKADTSVTRLFNSDNWKNYSDDYNMPYYNFSDCFPLLRTCNGLSEYEEIFVVLKDTNYGKQNYSSYEFYDEELNKLNTSCCSSLVIKEIKKINLTAIDIKPELIAALQDFGINPFNPEDKAFQDECYVLILNDKDTTLAIRKELESSVNLCEPNCKPSYVDLNSSTVECDCSIQENGEEKGINPLEDLGFQIDINEIISTVNLIPFKCFENLFDFSKFKKNLSGELSVGLGVIELLLMILFLTLFFTKMTCFAKIIFYSSINTQDLGLEQEANYLSDNFSSNIQTLFQNINLNTNVNESPAFQPDDNFDDLEFDDALNQDYRELCLIFSNFLKEKNEIALIFAGSSVITPIILRLLVFAFCLHSLLFVNTFLYTEEIIKENYYSDKDYDVLEILIDSFGDSIVSSIIVTLIMNVRNLLIYKKAYFKLEKRVAKNLRFNMEKIDTFLNRKILVYKVRNIIGFSILGVCLGVYVYYLWSFGNLFQKSQESCLIITLLSYCIKSVLVGFLCFIACILRYFGLKKKKL